MDREGAVRMIVLKRGISTCICIPIQVCMGGVQFPFSSQYESIKVILLLSTEDGTPGKL